MREVRTVENGVGHGESVRFFGLVGEGFGGWGLGESGGAEKRVHEHRFLHVLVLGKLGVGVWVGVEERVLAVHCVGVGVEGGVVVHGEGVVELVHVHGVHGSHGHLGHNAEVFLLLLGEDGVRVGNRRWVWDGGLEGCRGWDWIVFFEVNDFGR